MPLKPVSASVSLDPAATPNSAPSAARLNVLLDTKLPPKVVSIGGSYNLMVSDTQGLSRSEAMGVIDGSGKTMDACFDEIFRAGGKRGKVTMAVVLDGDGKVKSTRVELDELGDKDLPRCLEGVIKKMNWVKSPTRSAASLSIEWSVQS